LGSEHLPVHKTQQNSRTKCTNSFKDNFVWTYIIITSFVLEELKYVSSVTFCSFRVFIIPQLQCPLLHAELFFRGSSLYIHIFLCFVFPQRLVRNINPKSSNSRSRRTGRFENWKNVHYERFPVHLQLQGKINY